MRKQEKKQMEKQTIENEEEQIEEGYVRTPFATICVRCHKNKIANFTYGTCEKCYEQLELEKFKRRFVGSKWHSKETEKYQAEHKLKVLDCEAQRIVDKITRHFKLRDYFVKFRGTGDGGKIWNNGEVRLSHNPSFALICHELTHPLCWKKYKGRNISHNNKKWAYQLSRIIGYCRKKNFWQEEIQKWRTPQEVRPEPSKQELEQQEIAKTEAKVKKYEMKAKMFQKKLAKAKKRLIGLQKRGVLSSIQNQK